MNNLFNKIKSNKRLLYLFYLTVMMLFCVVLNVTYSLYTQSTKKSVSNITIGDLKYQMVINEVELADSVGTKLPTNTIIGDRIILLKAGKTEQFSIILTSLNNIDTRYEITYKVCTDDKCSKFIETPSKVDIAYHVDTPYVNGSIIANGNINKTIITDNQDEKDYFVQINLNVGYIHNELVLENQIHNSFSPLSLEGNLKIYAYVNNVQVDNFPTEPYYKAKIDCRKHNNDPSSVKSTFRYTAENGWEVDIFGLNRSLTTCRVDFTDTLKVTYEVLSTRYDCANVEDANKPTDPIISYTGNCEFFQDTENTDGTHTWRMKLLTSGYLSVDSLIYIDAFLVGGGGGGMKGGSKELTGKVHSSYRIGGGGGYTKTIKNIRLDNTVESYPITIGEGGAENTAATSAQITSAFSSSVAGGSSDGTGGSAGGTSGSKIGKSYGNGGQGTTTCEFDEGTLSGCDRGDLFAYAAGGGYGVSSGAGGVTGGGQGGSGQTISGTDGANNTGSGGGGAGVYDCWNSAGGLSYCLSGAGKGGSGVVVIRDVRYQ